MYPRTEQLIRDYLNRVSVAARGRLDADDRRAFLARTREFIEQNSRALPKADAAGVDQLLTRLGDPAMLVDRESDRLAARRLAGDPVPDPPVFLADGSAGKAVGPRPARARRWRQARGTLAGLMTSLATVAPPRAERPLPEPADDAPMPPAPPGAERPLPEPADDVPMPLAFPAASAGTRQAPRAAGSGPRAQRPLWPWLDPGQPAETDIPVNGAAPGATANGIPAKGAAGSGMPANGSSAGLLPQNDIPGGTMPPVGPFPSRTAGNAPAPAAGKSPNGTAANGPQAGKIPANGANSEQRSPATSSRAGTGPPGGPGNTSSRRVRTGRAVGSVADVVRGTGWARGVRHPGEAPFGEPGLGLGLPPGSLAAARDRAGKVIRAVAIWARKRPLETTAVVLLGLGGLIFPPVWLLGALVALASKVWDHRDKWIGLVLPVFLVVAGMAAAVSLGGPHHGVSGYAKEAWLFGDHLSRIVALLGAVYLTWRAERGRRRPVTPPWTKGGRLG